MTINRFGAAVLLAACAVFPALSLPGFAGDLQFLRQGSGPDLIEGSFGVFAANNNDGRDRTALFQIDGVSSFDIVDLWGYARINPWAGAWINADGGKMAYVGPRAAIPFSTHVEGVAYLGLGGYDEGSSRNMGSTLLFQTGLGAR